MGGVTHNEKLGMDYFEQIAEQFTFILTQVTIASYNVSA